MNIYVGNLPYSYTSSDLENLFTPYGEVTSAQVIMDRATGRSRGFGFIEMADDAAGREAIEKLDGYDLDGRRLTVNEARPRQERRGGGGGGGRY
ncbi:MAG TPA: RNA-binding protein [Acidimicrobiia bacterium]|jgi:cold-inducible RNA-binding protein|nr:RNA-binding protein [Acidimicrobiia bacterium]